MRGTGTIGGPRVVLLSRDAALRRAVDLAGVRCAAVQTGYEAAAELLAEPASALVVDLAMLTPRHARLLEIAKGLQVEILGLGMPSRHLDLQSLSGVRLVSPADLTALLARLTQAAPAAPSAVVTPPVYVPAVPAPVTAPVTMPAVQQAKGPVSPLVGRYQADAPAPGPYPELTEEELADLARPNVATAELAHAEVEEAQEVAPHETQPAAPNKDQAPPAEVLSPRDLLTQEEMTALLEDQR